MKTRLFLLISLLLFHPTNSAAVDPSQIYIDQLNKMTGELEDLIQREQANLLSPTFSEKFKKQVRKVESLVNKGDRVSKIEKAIKKAERLIEKVEKGVAQGQITYKDILKYRYELVNRYNSSVFLKELKKADRKFSEGGVMVDDGDLKEATRHEKYIKKALLKAEVAGSRYFYLTEMRNWEKETKKTKAKKRTPNSNKKAKDCLEELDEFIQKNPGDHTTLEQKRDACKDRWLKLKGLYDFADEVARKNWGREDVLLYVVNFQDELLQSSGRGSEPSMTIPDKFSALAKVIGEDRVKVGQLEELKQSRRDLKEKYQKVQEIFDDSIAHVRRDNGDIVANVFGLTFKPGSFEVTSRAFSILEKFKEVVLLFKGYEVKLIGHTDSVGNPRANKSLSYQRANTVYKYLTSSETVPQEKLEVIGAGDAQPMAPNKTTQNKRKNRRVELRIKNVDPL